MSKRNYKKDSKSYRKDQDPRDRKDHKKPDSAQKYSERDGKDVSDYAGHPNDPAWYSRNEQLVKDVTRIPFNQVAGRNVLTGDESKYYTYSSAGADSIVPGIMAMDIHIAPGTSTNPSSALNLAAAGVFSYMRKGLSTVASYQAADVMMYILGIDSIYTYYAHILRTFGLFNLYSRYNLYFPDDLIMACNGWGTEMLHNFKTNYAAYRTRFNNLVHKASSLYLPTDFTLTARHSWLFSNIFGDRDNIKAQFYLFRPAILYALNETLDTNGTCLEPFDPLHVSVGSDEPVSMQSMLDTFEEMIDAYRNSDSMMKIQGDMAKAFDSRGIWKLAFVDEGYVVEPTYDEYVLSQIHNLNALAPVAHTAEPKDGSDWIYQDVTQNCILFNPKTGLSASLLPIASGSQVMDCPIENPEVDWILEATRLRVTCDKNGYIKSIASDWCTAIRIYTHNAAGEPEVTGISYTLRANNYVTQELLAKWSVFDWAPCLYSVTTGTDNVIQTVRPFWETTNIVGIAANDLQRLNDNVILSMWSIPQMGTFEA